MPQLDFLADVHSRTKRDYLGRVNAYPKAQAAQKAKQFGYDYWDGSRDTGYGGYRYDGRWRKVAAALVQHYGLQPGARILDVGCGKGFLLYDFTQVLPGVEIAGIDISAYAIADAKPEVKPFLQVAHANALPFPDHSFDLVVSITTLHNLYCYDLDRALREIQRVGKPTGGTSSPPFRGGPSPRGPGDPGGGGKYIIVESYRNEDEKANLLYWQLTCEMFCTPREWQWWFDHCGYTGDYGFIYFE